LLLFFLAPEAEASPVTGLRARKKNIGVTIIIQALEWRSEIKNFTAPEPAQRKGQNAEFEAELI